LWSKVAMLSLFNNNCMVKLYSGASIDYE